MNTKTTRAEAEALIAEISEIDPGLKHAGDLVSLVAAVIKEATQADQGISKRIEEAGQIPGDVLVILMHWGALNALFEDLPADNPRHKLIAAGRAIGRHIAKKYGEKIKKTLASNLQ